MILSARNLFLQYLQSIKGSENDSICPDAFQTLGFKKIAESNPTIFAFEVIKYFHHKDLRLFFNRTPRGP